LYAHTVVKRTALVSAFALAAYCIVARQSSVAKAASNSPCCPVVELRQYTTLSGKRDALIRLYEEAFIESQEAVGIALPGQFRVAGFPNRFDWLQGFSSMPARKREFEAFYHGSAWKKYRKLVNTWLLENGNVVLLQPANAGSGFSEPSPRPPRGSMVQPKGVVVATIYYLVSYSGTQFDKFFEGSIRPVVQNDGARVLATFITDRSPNSFPILPVRTDVNLFVWFACYSGEAAYDRYTTALSNDPRWWTIDGDLALARMYIPPEVDILRPTPRSLLHC
jgi:hypothetical protein